MLQVQRKSKYIIGNCAFSIHSLYIEFKHISFFSSSVASTVWAFPHLQLYSEQGTGKRQNANHYLFLEMKS